MFKKVKQHVIAVHKSNSSYGGRWRRGKKQLNNSKRWPFNSLQTISNTRNYIFFVCFEWFTAKRSPSRCNFYALWTEIFSHWKSTYIIQKRLDRYDWCKQLIRKKYIIHSIVTSVGSFSVFSLFLFDEFLFYFNPQSIAEIRQFTKSNHRMKIENNVINIAVFFCFSRTQFSIDRFFSRLYCTKTVFGSLNFPTKKFKYSRILFLFYMRTINRFGIFPIYWNEWFFCALFIQSILLTHNLFLLLPYSL